MTHSRNARPEAKTIRRGVNETDVPPDILYTLAEARLIVAEEQRVKLVYPGAQPRKRKLVGGMAAPRLCASGLPFRSWI